LARRHVALRQSAAVKKGFPSVIACHRASRPARSTARAPQRRAGRPPAPMGRCTTRHFAQFTDVVATTARQDLGNSTMDVG
jgi:hypothetical protein